MSPPGFTLTDNRQGLGKHPDPLDPPGRARSLPQEEAHHAFAIMSRSLRFMNLGGLPTPGRIDSPTGVPEPMAHTTTATAIARLYDDPVHMDRVIAHVNTHIETLRATTEERT